MIRSLRKGLVLSYLHISGTMLRPTLPSSDRVGASKTIARRPCLVEMKNTVSILVDFVSLLAALGLLWKFHHILTLSPGERYRIFPWSADGIPTGSPRAFLIAHMATAAILIAQTSAIISLHFPSSSRHPFAWYAANERLFVLFHYLFCFVVVSNANRLFTFPPLIATMTNCGLLLLLSLLLVCGVHKRTDLSARALHLRLAYFCILMLPFFLEIIAGLVAIFAH